MLLQERVLIQADGLDNNVIKIKPPLIFTLRDADRLLQALDRSLTKLSNSAVF